MKNNFAVHSLGHAVLVGIYITLVSLIMNNAQWLFGNMDAKLLGPVAFLLLFVLSATVVGTLVLGRPVMMYMSGQKSEAIRFFGYTVGWLFAILLVVFLVLIQ